MQGVTSRFLDDQQRIFTFRNLCRNTAFPTNLDSYFLYNRRNCGPCVHFARILKLLLLIHVELFYKTLSKHFLPVLPNEFSWLLA